MEEILRTTITTTIEEIIKNSNLLCFDWATLIISILAIIISIWSAVWTVWKNNKQNYNNFLYEDILKKKLHKELPSLIHDAINISTKKADNTKISKLEKCIGELRKDILIFKYQKPIFYEKLDSILIKLDEQIVVINSRTENFDKKYEEITAEIKKMYKCIEDNLFK